MRCLGQAVARTRAREIFPVGGDVYPDVLRRIRPRATLLVPRAHDTALFSPPGVVFRTFSDTGVLDTSDSCEAPLSGWLMTKGTL